MYGENAGALRTELSTLLRQHRIQQRIGGPGIHTVPVTTTDAEREQIGRLIQGYRHGVLTWCRQALTSPGPDVGESRRGRAAAQDVELRRRLEATFVASGASLPTLAELTTPHRFALVDSWRLAARAAALSEHDLAGDMAPGRLDINQRLTIVKDTAEIIRGLIVLDRRYDNVPGWESLIGSTRLERAAEACAFITAEDYTVDRRGWRPPATTLDGPVRPGIAGVIQAEHNVLIHLNRFPNALNFRRLLDSQRELSTLLAARAAGAEPGLPAGWLRRGETYRTLQRQARSLGGYVGAGNQAVAEAANAISRLRRLPRDTTLGQGTIRDISTLFDAIDLRLADTFEHGSRERLYFVATRLPRIVDNDGQAIHAVRTRYVPITEPIHADLRRLVRDQLRPRTRQTDTPSGATGSRRELSEAIQHRPPSRAPGIDL